MFQWERRELEEEEEVLPLPLGVVWRIMLKWK
jgi:hypothetical protein